MRFWALLGATSLLTLRASAQPPPVEGETATQRPGHAVGTLLEIERAAGSEACPDAPSVFRAIARLFPERSIRASSDSAASVASARVIIRPTSAGHEAVVTVTLPRPGERVILENDVNCRGLADALAVALTMLVDPPGPETAPATPAESPPAPAPPAPAVLPPRPAPKSPETPAPVVPPAADAPRKRVPSARVAGRAAVIGGVGLLSEPALGAAVGVDLFHRNGWGLSLQGLRLWSRPAEAEGGSVELTLWAVLAGPCYRQRVTAKGSVDACLLLGAGSQSAQVQGFLEPKPGGFPWLVLGPMLRYQQRLGEVLKGSLGVGGVGQLRGQSFSVSENDGTDAVALVASAPRVGLVAELSFTLESAMF